MSIVQSVSLVVAVLTYKRPEKLSTGLPSILEHVRHVSGPDVSASVLVIDNDPEASARAIVQTFRDDPVRYVVEPVPGIAAARNRALDESADTELLVFLDDDEWPEPGWLATLLDAWRASLPAAVMGRVVSRFEHPLSPWVEAGEFFRRRRMPTGTRISVAAAGNLLLDLRQVRAHGVRFDDRLGLAGGEDTLFSRQLARAGGTMVWCDESAAVDFVPADRTTKRWVLTRAWSRGNASARVELILAEGAWETLTVRLRLAVRGIVRIVGGAARWLLGLVTFKLRHQARGARAVFRGAGIASGAFGVRFIEYARESEAE